MAVNIKVYSHGFFVQADYVSEYEIINNYVRNLTTYEEFRDPRTKQMVRQKGKVYAAITEDTKQYGMLLADLEPMLGHLRFCGLKESDINVEHVPICEGDAIEAQLKPEFTPRENQVAAVEFLHQPASKNRVLHADTGFGKTFCGFEAVSHYKVRTGFIMDPGHIKTWTANLGPYMGMGPNDAVVVQGSAHLRALIELRQIGQLDYKMIFFSAPTLREYVKDYEKLGPSSFEVAPQDLFSFLGIGMVVRDEVHESVHALILQTIYSHVRRIIFLSATLVSDNPAINKMYDRVFPAADRYESERNKHIRVFSVKFDTDSRTRIKANGFRGYSHVKYEQSIMKKKKLCKRYIDFLVECISMSFIREYKDGKKCLVFCSTIKMCELVTAALAAKYPHLTVGCFIGGAKKEVLYESDIVVGTPKSCGTGVDVPNLSHAWLTVALSSTQLSRQIFGRLRPIKKYPDEDPKFFFLSNNGISSHANYERKRMTDLAMRSKSMKVVNMPFALSDQ